ncbi:hypothetical protein AVEN_168524-1 [Araneus ventricosus]|uniref:Uncharacterized protein n=1 Tax=Araneus ventricosus TaxID=182803 RepID=A0A4Y2GIC8_ARAVE|nr:hypothetical protein AVEN_168524-1 [Araneus ventricosus]
MLFRTLSPTTVPNFKTTPFFSIRRFLTFVDSYHFTKPSAENTQLWWKSVLSDKLSRINIAKLVSFLTENENLIKQPPDATSSSDCDSDFSPSPRPQTYGLKPSRGLIPKTLISPPTNI